MTKKKKGLFYYLKGIFLLIFKIIHFILKGIYYSIIWVGSKIFKLLKKSPETKKSVFDSFKNERKHKAKYENFNELKKINGDLNVFESKLLTSASLIGIILGARGTGKSAIGMKLLENIKSKTDRNVCAMGFKENSVPPWISIVNNLEEISSSSVVLLDEAGIEFNSRSSMSSVNKLLSNLLLISRHKDLTILFISQNSSNLDLNILRQADFLIMKPSSLLQKDFERKKIKEIYEEARDHFKDLSGDPGLTYIYSNNYRGFISNPLPPFWGTEISKAYNNK